MPEPNETPEVIYPKCPHCGEELQNLLPFAWALPGSVIISVSCPACHTLLQIGFTPAPQEMPEPPRIARPS